MSNATTTSWQPPRISAPLWFYRLNLKLKRLRRALSYAFGTLSVEGAQDLLLECTHLAGWHPLLIITVDDTLELARQKYGNNPNLPALIESACARVAHLWDDYNETLSGAQSWTLEVAADIARQNGISLVPIDPFDQNEIPASNFHLSANHRDTGDTGLPALAETKLLCLPAPGPAQPQSLQSDPDPLIMTKQITLDEMLSCLQEMKAPSASVFKAILNAIKSLMAAAIEEQTRPS
jgi:hypothetical protein